MLFYSIMEKIVTMATDFGVEDHYVGVMKGVILSISNKAKIVDITHSIDSHSILQGAFIIKNYYKYFPENTIHLVVVDPGVGSDRRAILVTCDNHFFIGPDNGIFSLIYKVSSDYEVFELENNQYFLEKISSTFHGRDIFSPVAAHLSNGVPPSEFGSKITNPKTIELNEYIYNEESVTGEVIYKDKFGNLITNIPSALVNKNAEIKIETNTIHGISDFYSSVKEGQLLAIKSSAGYLEISVNKGSAANLFENDKLKVFVKNK